MANFYSHLNHGIKFLRENPQSLYSLFVLIIIVLSFIFVAGRFAQVTLDTKSRLQYVRTGAIHDTLIPFLRGKLNDMEEIQHVINEVVKNNEPITDFKLIVFEDGKDIISASIDESEIGSEYIDTYQPYHIALTRSDFSFSSSIIENGERFWITSRALVDDNNIPLGFIVTKESRAESDNVVAGDIQRSYTILIFIILLIVFLFIRYARIIDYSALYKRLKDIDSMKDDFISMASHELRSPLTVIKGYADEAKRDDIEQSLKNEHIGKIAVASKRLSDLVEDMLDVSRLQEGRIKFEMKVVNPESIINGVVENFKVVNEKGLKIEFVKGKSGLIYVDEERLGQILINVIGNSIKYTKVGSVKIEIEVIKNTLSIKVSDTGIGISAEDQKKLFQKFVRVQNEETKEITGTGLGLWITKQMVEKMNGNISVESIKGTGTTFIVKFPVAK